MDLGVERLNDSPKNQLPPILVNSMPEKYTQHKCIFYCKRLSKSFKLTGTEFTGSGCQTVFSNLGIVHQKTCAYTSQQNGIVERKRKHLLQVARGLMSEAKLPKEILGRLYLDSNLHHKLTTNHCAKRK